MTTILFFIIMIAVALHASYGAQFGPRILEGDTVKITDYPYQALLTYEDNICGGSILNSEYILTAAHCVDGLYLNKLVVRIGSRYRLKGGHLYGVSEAIKHPNFDHSILNYDAAIIKTSTKMELDRNATRAVRLANAGSTVTGRHMLVTGWGYTDEFAFQYSNTLRAVIVPVQSPEKCKEAYKYTDNVFTDTMFCSGFSDGGRDACVGDSGGPAVDAATRVQYGIVSWGWGCGRKEFPGVYVSVPVIRKFIANVTGLVYVI